MKYEYEKGGHVFVSDEWWAIGEQYPITVCNGGEPQELGMFFAKNDDGEEYLIDPRLVEAYEPPQGPEVYEWISSKAATIHPDEMPIMLSLTFEERAGINNYLTQTYGDPTVRTYNGEEPEQFGLTPGSQVLWWAGTIWGALLFEHLDDGDIWRKQPPAPKK